MSQSPNLTLPYIVAAQAQKHVTHNEAIRALDCIVQLAVADRNMIAPPATPIDGDRYIVPASATGAWSGQAGRIAAFQDGAWAFYTPREGWTAWVNDEDVLVAWSGSAWVLAGNGGATQNLPFVGVNATADATNRLAVSAAATLLNNEGAGHQLKINKASTADTASVLFQTNFSGRAEFGLVGDDNFTVKVSDDGSAFRPAITVDRTTGKCCFGNGSPTDYLTVTNDNVSAGQAVVARFNVWNSAAGATLTRLLVGQLTARNTMFLEVATEANGKGTLGIQPYGGNVAIGTTSAAERLIVNGNVAPLTDNAHSLGTAARRWSVVYAANGTINTSDARDKSVTGTLERIAGQMVDDVSPILFQWRVGGRDVRSEGDSADPDNPVVERVTDRPGKRYHAGFRAQDIRAAMDQVGVDFGAWGLDDKDDPDSRQWLRTEQLVPVLWQALRETRTELAALRAAVGAAVGVTRDHAVQRGAK